MVATERRSTWSVMSAISLSLSLSCSFLCETNVRTMNAYQDAYIRACMPIVYLLEFLCHDDSGSAPSKLFIHTRHLSRTWNACCWLRTSRWPTVVFRWWSPSLRLGLYQAATDVKGRRWSFPSGFPSGHCENFRCFKVRYSKSYLNNSLGSLKELKMTYFPNKNWEAFSESENSRIFQLTGVLAFPCPRTRWMPTTSWHNSLWKVLLILSGGGDCFFFQIGIFGTNSMFRPFKPWCCLWSLEKKRLVKKIWTHLWSQNQPERSSFSSHITSVLTTNIEIQVETAGFNDRGESVMARSFLDAHFWHMKDSGCHLVYTFVCLCIVIFDI